MTRGNRFRSNRQTPAGQAGSRATNARCCPASDVLVAGELRARAGPRVSATAAEAGNFLARVDARLLDLGAAAARSGWIQQNFITQDTEALTRSRTMDATAIRDYFAPLQQWLDQQLASVPVGW